jgi:hypothetical protein
METTFRLQYGKPGGGSLASYDVVFHSLADEICRQCGADCKGFMLSSDYAQYQAHDGPKIGWAVEGPNVFLRLANCKEISRLEHLTQLLKLFGMTVVESKLVQ